MKKLIRNNPLFFAFFFPALVDGTVTLLGQDSLYWQGQKVINEASPAYYFLLASPWLFLLGSTFWFVFWFWLFKKIKPTFGVFLMFLFISGHSWGSSSWLFKMLKEHGVFIIGNQSSIFFAWSLLVIYFVLIAANATYCLDIYIKSQKK